MNGECIARLTAIGVAYYAIVLRRISMTLHRWHEMECGDSNDYASWCVIRGRKDTKGSKKTRRFIHDDDGKPFMEYHAHNTNEVQYNHMPDRERGALKRLAKIMKAYPGFTSYVQGDPRGCALYILRPGDVPEGGEADAYYSRGVAVYK